MLRPDEALHGREIARRTGLAAGTITRELTRLAEVGLLKREKRGNQQLLQRRHLRADLRGTGQHPAGDGCLAREWVPDAEEQTRASPDGDPDSDPDATAHRGPCAAEGHRSRRPAQATQVAAVQPLRVTADADAFGPDCLADMASGVLAQRDFASGQQTPVRAGRLRSLDNWSSAWPSTLAAAAVAPASLIRRAAVGVDSNGTARRCATRSPLLTQTPSVSPRLTPRSRRRTFSCPPRQLVGPVLRGYDDELVESTAGFHAKCTGA